MVHDSFRSPEPPPGVGRRGMPSPRQRRTASYAVRGALPQPDSHGSPSRLSYSLQCVTHSCYVVGAHAGEDTYDGVPYGELVFAEVDWSEAVEHLRQRSARLGRPDEFDVEPEWATETLADPRRLVGSAGSHSGLTVKVLGWSASAPSRSAGGRGRLLKVIVAPKDHPPAGRWWGATAMDANDADRRRYEEEP